MIYVFPLTTSALGLIFSMSLANRKGIQPMKLDLKSTWSVLDSKFKACALHPLQGNNNGHKMNT